MDRLHQALIRASVVPRLGGVLFRRLHERWPAEHWPDASAAALTAHGWPTPLAESFVAATPAVTCVERWLATGAQRRLLALTDPQYPWLLRQIASPPLVLFVDGGFADLSALQLAIVGSRQYTPAAGAWLAAQMPALAAAGLVITSGLARGVDALAHQAALDCGLPTLAVVGTGPDLVYPAINRRLAARIREQGAIISELLPGTPAKPDHFPRRNRIISGLARGVLVLAAAERSGSLITAQQAVDQGRDVFALPGAPGNPLACGCNYLIQQGAKLVMTAADITEEWGLGAAIQRSPVTGKTALPSSGLLDSVGDEPTPVDLIAARSGWPMARVMQALLELELNGVITAVTGGYQRLRRTDDV